MFLWVLALALGIVHFAIPLVYYIQLKKYMRRPWNIRIDDGYKPRIAVILPTYNEVKIIEERLENIRQQDYPKENREDSETVYCVRSADMRAA